MPKWKQVNMAKKSTWRWLKSSVWTYPLVLLFAFTVVTALKISGTSVGVYHDFLYGINVHDPDLIYGSPKQVRADEWQSLSQLALAQPANDFNKTSPKVGSGVNLALQAEVPYKDWSAVFRPHTWGYFFLDTERGFAFKWWQPMLLLLTGAYFFALRILPGKRLLASMFSVAVGASPFLLWWYMSFTIGTLAYGFLALILFSRIIDGQSTRLIKNNHIAQVLNVLGLAFVLACFELLLYPPFQISVALVVIFYCVGYILKKIFEDNTPPKLLARRMLLILSALFIAGLVGIAFISSNSAAIHTISQSLYPGKRVIYSGDLSPLRIFDGYLMPLQQKGIVLFRNLSESSNFILLLPFLLLPGFAIMAHEYRQKRKVDWVFLFVQICGTIFLLRALVPFGDPLYHLLLLHKVPGQRLIIGMGFVGFIQLLLLMKKINQLEFSKTQFYFTSLVVGTINLVLLFGVNMYAQHLFPKLGANWLLIFVFILMFSAIIYALFAKKTLLAMVLLMIFSVGSSFRIMPLYKGLGFVEHSDLVASVKRISKPNDTWVTLDDIRYENLGLVAGRKNISGIQIYPDAKLWEQVGGTKFEPVYNREGHALFTTENISADMFKVKSNLFLVKFYCSKFILGHVDYALSTKPISTSCTNLVDTVNYPKITFYIYKVVK